MGLFFPRAAVGPLLPLFSGQLTHRPTDRRGLLVPRKETQSGKGQGVHFTAPTCLAGIGRFLLIFLNLAELICVASFSFGHKFSSTFIGAISMRCINFSLFVRFAAQCVAALHPWSANRQNAEADSLVVNKTAAARGNRSARSFPNPAGPASPRPANPAQMDRLTAPSDGGTKLLRCDDVHWLWLESPADACGCAFITIPPEV